MRLLLNKTSCFIAKMKIAYQCIFYCVIPMDQIISADNRILQEQLEKKVTPKSLPLPSLFFFTCVIAFFLALISVIIVYSLLL